jgi:hypothetical protein
MQPTKDTINYLEYVHLLKFLVEIEANEIHRKNEELLKKKKDNDKTLRQKEKRINEILLLFYPRLF